MPHPTIVTFGQTQEGEFPLLLVIGREPNCEGEVVNEVGSFTLDLTPNCCFWNRSRAQLARIGGNVAPPIFNALCRERNARPIIYADSLGICIQHGDPERDQRRNIWANNQVNVEAHIANIFGHAEIINRVELVILSGLDTYPDTYPVFQGAVASIQQKCEAMQIPSQHVGFFGGGGQ